MVDDDSGAEASRLTRKQPQVPISQKEQALQAQDRVDYAQFYQLEAAPLARFVIMACGASAEDAWDAAQTAFAKAWTRWHTISTAHRARRAWLRTTAFREYLRLIPDPRYRSGEQVPDRADTALVPEDVIALAEGTAHARAVLDSLPTT